MKMFTQKNVVLMGITVCLLILATVFYIKTDNQLKPEGELLSNQERVELYGHLTQDEIKKLPKYDRPDLAAAQNYEMIKDPTTGKVPRQKKVEAFKYAKKLLKQIETERGAIANVNWTERGPNNVAGRTRALMFDPNDSEAKKVWAGAIGGGIWYNNDITDEESSWHVINDFMANLSVSYLTYDPNNMQVFYASTGSGFEQDMNGAGIFKSTDAGVTWNQIESTANDDFIFVQKVFVTPNSTVLAMTLSGIMRSTDGGTTWTNVLSGRGADIEMAANGDLFASLGVSSTGSIHKSEDDGATWTDITENLGVSSQRRIELATAPSDANVIYAVASRIAGASDVAWFIKSEDGGETWTEITIPLYYEQDCTQTDHFTRGQSFFDLIMKVHPEDPQVVYVGGIDLYRSFNGGIDWELVSYWTGACDTYVHADQHAMDIRPGHPNEMIFGNDGGVAYSNDIGNKLVNPNFLIQNNNYNVTTFYSTATANEVNSNYFLAGAQDNGTQQFTRPLINATTEATGGDGGFCFIDQDDATYQITSFVYNSYRLSTNGGASFTNISNNQSKGRFINPTEYDSEANVLYGAGNANEISRILNVTTTAPENINLDFLTVNLEGNIISNIKASPYTDNRLFVGVNSSGGGRIFIIDNAHNSSISSTEITGAFEGSPGNYVSSIDVGASDDHLLVTFTNYNTNSVYETTDGGANWVNKEGNLPDMPVRWGIFNPENRNEVLLATELGVWSTDNLAASEPEWEPTNSGLANTRCDMLKYREVDGIVAVATYGRGLFTTDVFAKVTDANFVADANISYANTDIQFTDGSLRANNSWSWDFGDGNTSTEQHPTHAYSAPGTYTVSLTIDNGSATKTETDYITILTKKPAPYSLTDGGDFESSQSDFASFALEGGINIWELGTPSGTLDATASGTNAWKTGLNSMVSDGNYASALYTPAFDLTDVSGQYKLKFKKSFEFGRFCDAPLTAQVHYTKNGGKSWSRLGGVGDLNSVNWYNKSPESSCVLVVGPDGYGWNSPDETLELEDTEYDISFLAGNENVAFRFVFYVFGGASEGYTDGMLIDDVEITFNAPTADFVAGTQVAVTGQGVQFTYASAGAISYLWDFGDGNTSTEKDPVHAYDDAGLYTISLTVNGSGGEVTETKHDLVRVLANKSVPYLAADGGDFESNQSDFAAENVANTGFELGQSTFSGKSGTASGDYAWVTGINTALYDDNSVARLYTPGFAFTTFGEYTLEFKTNYSFEDNWDGFIVEYSTDRGNTWIKLNDEIDEDNWYNQTADAGSPLWPNEPIFSGNSGGEFLTKSTDVSFLAPNDVVVFRFVFQTDPAEVDAGMALDDFTLTGPEPAEATVDFEVSDSPVCKGSTVTFTHKLTGTAANIRWNFGEGASPSTAFGAGPHDVTFNEAGNFDVSLTVNTVSGDKTETKTVEIGEIPTDITLSETARTCQLSTASIIVPSSEAGVSYQLFSSSNDNEVGDPVVGDGNDIALVTGILSSEATFYVVGTSEFGCTNRMTTEVTVELDPKANAADIVFIDGVLHADETGVVFQWYKNGDVLEGETNQTYTPESSVVSSDFFRVDVTFANGCFDQSDSFFYGANGLTESAFSKQLKVLPNPSDGHYQLKMNLGQQSELNIRIYNTSGMMVKNFVESTQNTQINAQIDISEFTNGIYILEMVTNKGTAYKKLMKQ